MITTQSSTITIINNGWVIKNSFSDQLYPKGGDSLYLAWDNLSEIWNHPAMLMQQPIPPKYDYSSDDDDLPIQDDDDDDYTNQPHNKQLKTKFNDVKGASFLNMHPQYKTH